MSSFNASIYVFHVSQQRCSDKPHNMNVTMTNFQKTQFLKTTSTQWHPNMNDVTTFFFHNFFPSFKSLDIRHEMTWWHVIITNLSKNIWQNNLSYHQIAIHLQIRWTWPLGLGKKTKGLNSTLKPHYFEPSCKHLKPPKWAELLRSKKKCKIFQHTMVIFQHTTTTSFWWTPFFLRY
jgi:hypothetical protein